MKYCVQTFRDAGLEARWSKTRSGAPIIVVRWPAAKLEHQRDEWWLVTNDLWIAMQRLGVIDAFDAHTLLGNIFSLPC